MSAGIAGVIKPYSDLHTDSEIRYFPSIDSVDVVAEGVIIATPTTLHAANGIAPAARVWHMLIEKPVVAAPAEAPALIEAIKSAGLHCPAGHHRRYHPSVLSLPRRYRLHGRADLPWHEFVIAKPLRLGF